MSKTSNQKNFGLYACTEKGGSAKTVVLVQCCATFHKNAERCARSSHSLARMAQRSLSVFAFATTV
jgi:hypothetical protein